jgi:cytochrome oxidase Cu insertion factor (SCO1/SenC/PrrC family)
VAFSACAVVVAAAAVLAGWLERSDPARDERYVGSQPPPGIALAGFSLRNYDGRMVRSAELRGGVVLLTFLDSQCTESCPVIAWTVARALDALAPAERDQVTAVAISSDPSEDTPGAVRRFLERNTARGRLLYLGAGQPVEVLRAVWGRFDVLSSLESGKDSLHSAPVRVYDRDGEWVATLHAGADLTPANVLHDLRLALGN